MRMRGALERAEIRFRASTQSSYSAYCNSDGYALTLYTFSEQPIHDAMVVTTVNNRLIQLPTHWYTWKIRVALRDYSLERKNYGQRIEE